MFCAENISYEESDSEYMMTEIINYPKLKMFVDNEIPTW